MKYLKYSTAQKYQITYRKHSLISNVNSAASNYRIKFFFQQKYLYDPTKLFSNLYSGSFRSLSKIVFSMRWVIDKLLNNK